MEDPADKTDEGQMTEVETAKNLVTVEGEIHMAAEADGNAKLKDF